MSGEISFSGLASGIDFSSMVDQLIEAEKYQANKLDQWKQEWEVKSDKLDELGTKFSALQTTITALKSRSSFFSRLGTTTDSTIATIAVDSTAIPGSYNITVATNSKHIMQARGQTDATSNVLTAGQSIQIDIGAESYTVNGGAGKSLNDIRTEINANMAGVTAEVVDDGSSSNAFRLQLTSVSGGTANEIIITETGSDLFASAIDSVEEIDALTGDALVANSGTGNYTGHVNKRFLFQITEGGTVGTDGVEIVWTDEQEGKSGSITISGAGTYTVAQGVELTFTGGEIYVEDGTYALDVFHPNMQAGQDSGLAQAEKEVHSGMADSNTTAVTTSDATFSYSYAGIDISPISVAAGTTLQGLAGLINTDSDTPGVKATIINDGSGMPNSYHLVLTGTNSGAANKIEDIDFSSFSAGAFASGSFSKTQVATNAMVKLDAYPSGDQWLQTDSNLISGLIEGASITIKSAGSTEITITNDVDAMADKVEDFVDAYNDVLEYINEITAVSLNEEGEAQYGQGGALVGNYGIEEIRNSMRKFISGRAEGFDEDVDEFVLIPQLGITTGDSSLLEYDETVLKSALNNYADDVVSFFSDDNTGVSSNSYVSYYSSTSLTEPGVYNYKIDVDASGDITSAIYWYDGETEADGRSMSIDSTGKFATATTGDAKGLAIEVTSAVSTTLTGSIRLKQGKAIEPDDVADKIADDTSGILKVMAKNYENIIDNIDLKIERELARIDLVEKRYRAKFARLEVRLQEYNSQMERLQSELAKLN
ncbi:MAG: flagellar filament capping protein FliD [Candidatus Cloacimonetes bacterium]|nr:flagellar filament capping protein FliD [Candidatus Cloacimonadota bacterium]